MKWVKFFHSIKSPYNASSHGLCQVFKSCLNSRAVSLTEALIAAGMVGGLSLGYLQLSGDHQKSQKKIEAGFEIDMLTLEMAQTLSNDDACTKTLRNKTLRHCSRH